MRPLVDLHRHLEGAIRPSTLLELAARPGEATDASGLRDELVAPRMAGGLLPYLAKIDRAAALVRTAEAWRRVTAEAIADAYDDGLTAVELRFSPRFIEKMSGVSSATALEAIAQSAAETSRDLPIEVGLIGIVLRDEGPDSAVSQMTQLVRNADALIGVDLAGDEAGYPAAMFAPAFARAHEHGLNVTIHAGEAAGPESVWEAMRHLKPSRIGHGVRSAEDPRLLEHLVESDITLEVAITSNVQTGAASEIRRHQVSALVDAGVRVAISTDNPTVSNTRLSREVAIAAELVGEETVDQLRDHAHHASFLHL